MVRPIFLILVIISSLLDGYSQKSELPKLKPKPQISKSQFDIGLIAADSFKLHDITKLPSLNIYELIPYKIRSDNQPQHRLVSNQNISDSFDTYILFDEYYSEAGSFVLYTVDSLGYLINSIEFEGGDGLQYNGYYTKSRFLSKNQILKTTTFYSREKSEKDEYLKTWELKTTYTKYLISVLGEIYIESEETKLKKNQNSID